MNAFNFIGREHSVWALTREHFAQKSEKEEEDKEALTEN